MYSRTLPLRRKIVFPFACFSKVPKLFGSLSGAAIRFISSQRWGSNPSSFAVLLVFHTLKACWKISFQNKWIAVWPLAFRARKVFGTYEEKYPGARFSKVPRLFGRNSGDIILFVSSKRRRLEARNFAVILIFIPYTTYGQTSFTDSAGRSFTNGFSGPKSFRDFRETGPCRFPVSQ